uniref:Uncharacterized protein n=1 Tax=Nephroselmis olivacea TaxID=31312 RepID=Q9T3L4_NEPOL|nr:hypothetical protein NeolCp100 [Nephroselmis olivacea]NP_050942.1 hypothetical protein NeolCp137 [Nephroselmis olivacea]AAD54876.1 unknown [Nephroselmis olivacea]AAD54913.1 unknown [Nephroselmis olivacea]
MCLKSNVNSSRSHGFLSVIRMTSSMQRELTLQQLVEKNILGQLKFIKPDHQSTNPYSTLKMTI